MIGKGFRFRILLAAVLPALLLGGVFAAILMHWTQTVLESSLRERVEAVARQLATTAEFHLFTGDTANLRALVDGVARDEMDIVAMAIVDRDGLVWASKGLTSPPGAPMLWYGLATQAAISCVWLFRLLVRRFPSTTSPAKPAITGRMWLGARRWAMS